LLAPILSFTCEEVWQYLPAVESRGESVHLEKFPAASDILGDNKTAVEDAAQREDWKILRAVREQVLKVLEDARAQKLIGKGIEAQLIITADGPAYSVLERYKGDLRYFFIVSAVILQKGASGNGASG